MEKTSNPAIPATDDNDRINQFIWSAFSLSSHLHEIRQAWAKRVGVSGPQWLILFAIMSDDNGSGVSVGRLAEKLHVKSTFITAQIKLLEERGMVVRKSSPADGRIVLISITKEARNNIKLSEEERKSIHNYIFKDLTENQFDNLILTIEIIDRRASEINSEIL